MKIKFFLLLCLFILTIKCGDDGTEKLKKLCRDTPSPKNKEDCFSIFNTTVQESEKMYCCYEEYKVKNEPADDAPYVKEFKGCEIIDKEEYEDLDAYMEGLKSYVKKDGNEIESITVYCDEKHSSTASSSSVSLKFGLIGLFAALLI